MSVQRSEGINVPKPCNLVELHGTEIDISSKAAALKVTSGA